MMPSEVQVTSLDFAHSPWGVGHCVLGHQHTQTDTSLPGHEFRDSHDECRSYVWQEARKQMLTCTDIALTSLFDRQRVLLGAESMTVPRAKNYEEPSHVCKKPSWLRAPEAFRSAPPKGI